MPVEVLISSKSGLVSGGDWAPALAAAYADIDNTGGTIFLDAEIELKSTTNFTMIAAEQQNINIIGRGAKCVINGGTSHQMFQFGNHCQVRMADILFIGETGQSATPDCNNVILAGYVQKLTLHNLNFAGIVPSDSLIQGSAAADMHISNSKFGGCGGHHIRANGAVSLTVHSVEMYDYQQVIGNYYDRSQGRSWITALNPPAGGSVDSVGKIDIQNVNLDEGAAVAIDINGYRQVKIDRYAYNTREDATAVGINLTNVDQAEISQFWCGYNPTTLAKAMKFTACGDVNVNGFKQQNGTKPVVLDAATRSLKITNSPNVVIEAAAGANYEINGVTYKGGLAQVG